MIFILACGNKAMTPAEFMQWFSAKENVLVKDKQMGEFVFTATYMPTNYFVAKQRLEDNKNNTVDSNIYIRLKLSLQDKKTDPLTYKLGNGEDEQMRLTYLMSEIIKDVYIVEDKDTIYASMHHYERTYHAGNSMLVMFIFDRILHQNKDIQFVYHDQIFGNGPIQFTYFSKDLEQIPSLK